MVHYLFRHIRRDDGGYGDCEVWPLVGFFVFALEFGVVIVVLFVCGTEVDSASPLLTSTFFAFFLVIGAIKLLV